MTRYAGPPISKPAGSRSQDTKHGLAHGDLSPYNLLVDDGRLVMIDFPQVVDVIANPNGRDFLARDARNVATWFARAGHPSAAGDALADLLGKEARLVWLTRLVRRLG